MTDNRHRKKFLITSVRGFWLQRYPISFPTLYRTRLPATFDSRLECPIIGTTKSREWTPVEVVQAATGNWQRVVRTWHGTSSGNRKRWIDRLRLTAVYT